MCKNRYLLLAVVCLAGCGGGKQYKDDPLFAAQIKARKEQERAAQEAPPKPYTQVEVTEKPKGRILYNCFRDRTVTMWGVDIGGEPERLKWFRTPRVSPNGKQVLVSYLGDKTNRFELGVTGATKGEVTDVATSTDHDSVSGAWSPDGKQIAYVQRKNNKGEIAIINLDGTDRRLIAPHEKDDKNPNWSPDGKTIAFSSFRGGRCGIYTVPVGGGQVKRITPDDEKADQPAYSPDGNYLAYVVTYRHPTNRDWVRDLRVMKLDGSGQRTLVTAKKQIVGVDWSPGGQWLIFGCKDEGQSDLCIVDINGEGFQKITDDPYGDTHPSWQSVAAK